MPLRSDDIRPEVIVGMGLAGWSEAYNLIKRGCKKLVILDKRANPYERFNTLAITSFAIKHIFLKYTTFAQHGYELKFPEYYGEKYWVRLEFNVEKAAQLKKERSEMLRRGITPPNLEPPSILDIKFFAMLEREQRTLPISKIQEYLRAKTLELAAAQHCEIQELHAEAVRVSTEFEKPVLEIKDNPALHFKNLFIATGAGDFDRPGSKTRSPLPVPWHTNKTHCAILLKLIPNVDPEKAGILQRKLIEPYTDSTSIITTKHLPKLKPLGWHKANVPIKFIDYNTEERTFYFVGECPDELDNLQGQEKMCALEKWAATIVYMEYPDLKAGEFHIDHAQRNPASTFTINTSYIRNPFTRLATGEAIFLIGDALLKPCYIFGHGFEFALRSSYAAAECFADDTFVSEEHYLHSIAPLVRNYLKRDYMFNLMTFLKSAHVYRYSLGLANAAFKAESLLFSASSMFKKPSLALSTYDPDTGLRMV